MHKNIVDKNVFNLRFESDESRRRQAQKENRRVRQDDTSAWTHQLSENPRWIQMQQRFPLPCHPRNASISSLQPSRIALFSTLPSLTLCDDIPRSSDLPPLTPISCLLPLLHLFALPSHQTLVFYFFFSNIICLLSVKWQVSSLLWFNSLTANYEN